MTQPSGPCTGASRPKSGQPEFFFYDPIVLPPPYATVAAWLTSALVGLPNTPVRTSDFCATAPTGDLPTTQDWLLIAFPVAAALAGTYARLGNLVKQQTFSDR